MRIFLDANVFFSAAKTDGAVRELLARLSAAGHALCADDYVVEEARRNLQVKSAETLAVLDVLLRTWEVARYQPQELPAPIAARLPEKDQPVLTAAMRLQCEALVTGDRTHFGALFGKRMGGIAIHSPRSLAQALLG